MKYTDIHIDPVELKKVKAKLKQFCEGESCSKCPFYIEANYIDFSVCGLALDQIMKVLERKHKND